jgi:hypothetical protein
MGFLKRKDDYRLEEVDGELLLYHPGSTKILYCNETASLIWQLCDGTRGEEEIVSTLSEAYPDAGDAVAEDVKATLHQFLEHQALEIV